VVPTYALAGNHDMPGDSQSEWAVSALGCLPAAPGFVPVESVSVPPGGIAYMAYTHSVDKFLAAAREAAAHPSRPRTLVCHGEIDGAKYDNGHPAPGGVDPALIPFDFVISGHYHTRQAFGNVDYPGTARWDTQSDANQEKGIWVYEHSDDGAPVSKKFVSTAGVCVPILELEWREGQAMPAAPAGSRTTYSLVGSSAWVGGAKKEASASGATTRSTFTDSAAGREGRRKSAGLGDYLASTFEPVAGVERREIAGWLGIAP